MTDDVKLFVIQALRPPIYGESVYVMSDRLREAAKIIESLSAQLEQVTREREAAVEALRDTACCADCKNYATQIDSEPCKTCLMCPSQSKPNWQWRGVEANQ